MTSFRAASLLLMMACIWVLLAGIAHEPVSVTVEGGYYRYEPAYIRLRVRVEPDTANRALTVALVSDGFERSSLEELAGEKAAPTRWVEYKDVPAGEYEAVALVHRPQDRPLQARERFTVLSRY